MADGTVYGDTSTSVFALNAATGKTIWVDGSLLNSGQGAFEIQPQVADGRVYLASAYGSGPGGGVLMALNATTGRLLWKFNTVLGPGTGVQALGLGSGGAWETPLVGSDGSVTFGIGNPYQSIGRRSPHPSRQLYTDSAVNLDAATGKLRWYYQAVPDDFKDHDLQASPISTSIGGVPVIITAGKMGYVYALNARSGALLWKTPVGEHNGHDDDSLLALSHQLTIKFPYTFVPGSLGGVLSNMAVAGGSVYVATIDLPITYTGLNSVDRQQGRRSRNRGGGGAQPGHRQGRMGHQGPLDAARRGHGLQRPGLHHALQRRAGRSQPQHRRDRLPAPAAHVGRTRRSPSSATRCWSRRAAPRRQRSGGGGNPQLVAYTVP